MNKGIKMCLIVIPLVILTIILSVFFVQKIRIFSANKKAEETIVVGDNIEIEELEKIQQKEIVYDDSIGTLTIPNIL